MKKNYPKILAITLLTIMAVLTVFAGTGTLSEFLLKYKSDAEAVSEKASKSPTEKPEAIANDVPIDEVKTTEKNIEVEANNNTLTLPLNSQKSNRYEWEQSIPIEGLKMLAIHQTTKDIFIVSGDLSAENKALVYCLDYEGTLHHICDLFVARDTIYLDSAITSDGLVIVLSDGNKTYVETMDYSSYQVSLLELEPMTSARVFTTSGGFLLWGKEVKNTLYKIEGSVIKKQVTLPAGTPIEIMEEVSGYVLFSNTSDGYSVYHTDRELFEYMEIAIPDKELIKIIPIVENKSQFFIVVERQDYGIFITKYAKDFDISSSSSVSLGMGELVYVYDNNSTILTLLKNSIPRLYLADYSLNFKLSTIEILQNTDVLLDGDSYEGGYVLMTKSNSESTTLLVNMKNDGSIYKTSIICNENARFIRTSDGGVIMVYDGEKGIELFKTDLG